MKLWVAWCYSCGNRALLRMEDEDEVHRYLCMEAARCYRCNGYTDAVRTTATYTVVEPT